MLPLQLFSDYITGQLGGTEEQETVSRIARVIVAGNLVAAEEEDMSADQQGTSREMPVFFSRVPTRPRPPLITAHMCVCVCLYVQVQV